mgnify:CR=1 FL=1
MKLQAALFWVQAIIVVMCFGAGLVWPEMGLDAGLGSLSAFISYSAFSLAFRKAKSFSDVLGCEVFKLITIASSVAVVFLVMQPSPIFFVAGFLLAQVASIAVPLRMQGLERN